MMMMISSAFWLALEKTKEGMRKLLGRAVSRRGFVLLLDLFFLSFACLFSCSLGYLSLRRRWIPAN